MTEAEWLAATDPTPMLRHIALDAIDRRQVLFDLACCRRVSCLIGDDRVRNVLALMEMHADGSAADESLRHARGLIEAASYDAFTERHGAEADANFCNHPAYSLAVAVENATASVASLYQSLAGADLNSSIGLRCNRSVCEHSAHAAGQQAEAAVLWMWMRGNDGVRHRSPGIKMVELAFQEGMSAERSRQARVLRCIFGNPFRPVAADPSWLTSSVVALTNAIYFGRAFDRLPVLADALEEAGCNHPDVLSHCRGEGVHDRGCWVVDLVLGKA